MDETGWSRRRGAMRRSVLGDAYVDAMTADPDPAAVEFQDYITSMAWGVWTRGGPLSHARPQPAGPGDDGGARADGRVPPARRQRRPGPASPTRSSTSCCSRSPPTAACRPGSRPGGRCCEVRAEREAGRDALRATGRLRRARQHGRRAGVEPGARPATTVVAHDALGPDRAPEGATHVADASRRSPGGPTWWCSAFRTARPPSRWRGEILGAPADRRTTHVVDTSTIGVGAARGDRRAARRRRDRATSMRRCRAASPGPGPGRSP